SETKRQAISKCRQAGMLVTEAVEFDEYWSLLTQVLSKFGVGPVHSLEEINLLRGSFPGNIKLFEARLNGELLAGIVIYDYNDVVHTQYMANSAEGRKLGALDFINSKLISETFSKRKYYSFGISTEQEGTVLNEGLMQQKEMMGGRAIVHDFYKIILT
ncbi:MAG: GNAT family N-acetyltransferase, partial [Chitinophagaceae bacterium]